MLNSSKKEWFETGKLKFCGDYTLDKKEGWHREWNEEGTLIAEVFYKNDLPDGIARFWYEKDKLKEVIPFTNGKRNGKNEVILPKRQTKSICRL